MCCSLWWKAYSCVGSTPWPQLVLGACSSRGFSRASASSKADPPPTLWVLPRLQRNLLLHLEHLLPSLFPGRGVCRAFFLTLSPPLQMLNSYFSLLLNYVIAEALLTSLVDSALDCDRFEMAFWSQLNKAQSNTGADPVSSHRSHFCSLPSLSALPYKLNRACYKRLLLHRRAHLFFPLLNADLCSVSWYRRWIL